MDLGGLDPLSSSEDRHDDRNRRATGGQSALALRLLLAVFSSKISSGTNQAFGEEFRLARKASEDVGTQLVLGDRLIEITLKRAWKSLMLVREEAGETPLPNY